MIRLMSMVMLASAFVTAPANGEAVLLEGSAPEPIEVRHFPDRLHTFVWRNWESADLDDMARVLGTTVQNLRATGASMGLPPHRPISDLQKQRGYISVIRRNWHLLNYDQLLTLLGWDAERLAYTLKEDDFLWFKLGMLKPKCAALRYKPPSDEAKARCAEIRRIVESSFGDKLTAPMEPRFAFIEDLSTPMPDAKIAPPREDDPIRYIYSYFAVYGDPLLDASLDPYPDGLLQRLAAAGVNGVWLHTVLQDLAPSEDFPEFGEGHETRLANLRRLVERAARYGVKVYLYMNEPRSKPDAWFDDHPEIAGHRDEIQGNTAMCTSVPIVRKFVRESLTHVFNEVPGLGGVFTITMVENLTNCYSRAHGKPPKCPRCSKRTPQEVIAEINATIAEGVHAASPDAKVIVWDWVWEHDWVEGIVERLPEDVYLLSVSEWDLPINRGGVDTVAGEYSLSAVGPGERATRNWRIAREHGLGTLAKVQLNCSWELSVVPYLPVMDLVAEHLENLTQVDIDGLMLSWTLGGYPSPNLQLLKHYQRVPAPDREKVLRELAEQRFGRAAATHGRAAWRAFSEAFREYPFHIIQLYNSPVQRGPANPLFPAPTGYQATMVGLPYDDLTHWRAVYPGEVFVAQFEKVSRGWQQGLKHLEAAVSDAETPEQREHATNDLRVAEAAYTHFKSVANQTQFTMARNELLADPVPADPEVLFPVIRTAVEDEITLAKRLFELTRADSRIGFEATNHYNYYPLDLVEKVINCRYILDHWLPAHKKSK